jgi:superfamily II DNA/RNA helicase
VETAARANSKLQEILKPFFLQRLKKDILLDMPPKREFVVWTHLSSLQRNLYEDYVANGDIVNSLLSNETKSPLVAINWLRMLIGHPLLIDKRFDRELSTLSNISVERLLEESVKLKVLADLLKALSMAGHRTLIFSNSTMTLDIIQRVLNGFKVSRIDGKTKERDRQQYVEDFNRNDSSINMMLLSTKAGGLGLTLIGADRVIIFNPSWNPTDDSQAVDRCYRIGQKKPVEVYRFIAAGTVEEKAYEKQIFKDGINRVVTNISGNSTERYFDQNDLKKLFHLSPKGKCEFLEKLQKKGRLGNINSSKHSNFFERQEGVIGLSRHDAVYQDVNRDENSVSMTPFSGSTPYKVIGKARKALLGESSEWDEAVNYKSGRIHKGIAASIEKPISDANFLNKFEISKVRINEMKDSGRKNEALSLLLDILDDQEKVNKEQRIWMHREIATIGYSLGLLSK